jgi:alpha-D-ribose 1-methylphosphonate 5-triphosphate diphosphatase
MSERIVLANARLALADEVVHGHAVVERGVIHALDGGATAVPGALDLGGDFLLPGFVELHTDNFERHLMPRPKVQWPPFAALLQHDAEIAAAGITTVYDALGVGDSDLGALRGQDARAILAAIDAGRSNGVLRAEHRLHVRCELPAPNTWNLFAPFEGNPLVGLISLMDHTPGQRQWTNLDSARVYYTGKKAWSESKFLETVAEAPERQRLYAEPHRARFVEYARRRGIPLASHDDTLPEHVEQARAEGAAISEFPTSVAAARAAHRHGLSVIMGGPNLVRGGSHSGNVAAIELARLRLLDTISSDYVPASLLQSAFILQRDAAFTLPEAIATITRNPARSVGLDDRGEIAPGLRADLVRVRLVDDQPVVISVWREGLRVA